MIHRAPSGLQVVVLAAGFSARLGRPKALTRIHGVSLLARTVSVLAKVTGRAIIVVVPPRAAHLRIALRGHPIAILTNPDRAQGLSASVARALRKTRHSSATLLVPADLPELAPRDVARLISRWRGAKRRVVARRTAERAATPLILPKFLYPLTQRLAGDVGLRDLIADLQADERTLVDLPSATRDVDTPQDLADARRQFPKRVPGAAS